MTAGQLSAIAGVVLSLAFSYVPGLSAWYEARTVTGKRIIMAALVVIVAGGAYWLSCAGVLNLIACNDPGATALIDAVIAALAANQATYLISPRRAVAK